jgi:hypothetical protein
MLLAIVLALTLTSPDLTTGGTVPRPLVWNRDGCDGANRRPRLSWDAPPSGTHDLLLTVIDPDAPMPGGAIEGKNDFGTVGWGGPCPPPGKLHHYVFTLSARDLNGRVIATSRLTPVYKR